MEKKAETFHTRSTSTRNFSQKQISLKVFLLTEKKVRLGHRNGNPENVLPKPKIAIGA
jgi:hypothetical protein